MHPDAQEFLSLLSGMRDNKRKYLLLTAQGKSDDEAAKAVGVKLGSVQGNWMYRDKDATDFKRCLDILDTCGWDVQEDILFELSRRSTIQHIAFENTLGYQRKDGGFSPPRTEVLRMGMEIGDLANGKKRQDAQHQAQIDVLQSVLVEAVTRQIAKVTAAAERSRQLTDEQIEEARFSEV